MFRDSKRAAYYSKQRKQHRRDDLGTSGRKVRSGKGKNSGLAPQTKAYLQAYGSPFTDADQLPFSLEPRIPDPDYTGSTVVCNHQGDFNLNVPNGNTCIMTSTKPFFFGGIDVMTNVDIYPVTTMYRSWQVGVPTAVPEVGGIPTPARPTLPEMQSEAACGLQNFVSCLKASQNALNTTLQSAQEYYDQWESASWKQRMIGSAVKAHDIGAVETQRGLIQAFHLRPEAFVRIGRELCDTKPTTSTTVDCQRARAWLELGPLSLFAMGDSTDPPFMRPRRANQPVGGYGSAVNNNDIMAAQYFDGLSAIHNGINTDAIYMNQQSFLKELFQQHSIRNRDAGDEFLCSDGVSMRGYHKSADRPFSHSQTPVWAIGENAVATTGNPGDPLTDQVADQALRRAGKSRGEVMDWLTSYTHLFTTQTEHIAQWIYYFPASVVPNIGLVGDYQLALVCWGAGGTWETGAENYGNTFTYSVILCDLDCVPLSMRFTEEEYAKTQPSGDAPFMFFHIDGVDNDRTFKIYRADYSELECDGDFIVPGKFSPVDANFDQVAMIGAGFPTITKGFTFFASLAQGIKQAATFVWQNREAISKGVGLVKGMISGGGKK